ncbi:(Na+)-NQR maturation NqrM [Psychrobium sp. 1_MG-2023]|uniref:(Na+)-NQR maturation NqrM n=1 Tax=Psychrobium sp. 1_MG-2023 TaxID=3062624 RepID=UPI000C33BB75|nr:(Na+)-NQR maturation NqrM [Psychrobium sp. 1_MG-2023]MDP2560020.1 (Na+)-NQR maturation NqrM [Psychrobium sp. 1_MG-2023]PKF56318.1 Na(+)-translocating NADH-quinone reductase subunit E [Alteromonadales bacterium alter-6D02]
MMTFIYAFAAFVIVIVAMAVGYIFQKKAIAGSCGGLGAIGVEKACDCDNPCDKRKKRMAQEQIKISLIE